MLASLSVTLSIKNCGVEKNCAREKQKENARVFECVFVCISQSH